MKSAISLGSNLFLVLNVFCFPLVPIISNGLLANRHLVFETLAEDLEVIADDGYKGEAEYIKY